MKHMANSELCFEISTRELAQIASTLDVFLHLFFKLVPLKKVKVKVIVKVKVTGRDRVRFLCVSSP